MLNTRDLEKRWLKYKIKSLIPYFVILLSSSVILIIATLFFSNKDKVNSHITEQAKALNSEPISIQKPKEIAMPAQNSEPPVISSIITEKEMQDIYPQKEIHQQKEKEKEKENTTKVILKPSMDFMKKMQESSDGYYVSSVEEETFNTPYSNTQQESSNVKQVTPVEITVEEQNIDSNENKKIVITKQNSLQDLQDAEKRFKKNNSPALSLFLAKQYYALNDYHKSYNYALITNQLDKTNEDSWLIFSKSLVKLGKKDLAVKALKEYIKFSHSGNAELLLDEIISGKFQ